MELCCVGCADYMQCGCCLVLFQLSKQHIFTFQLVRSGESEAFDDFWDVAERVGVRVSRIFGRVVQPLAVHWSTGNVKKCDYKIHKFV